MRVHCWLRGVARLVVAGLAARLVRDPIGAVPHVTAGDHHVVQVMHFEGLNLRFLADHWLLRAVEPYARERPRHAGRLRRLVSGTKMPVIIHIDVHLGLGDEPFRFRFGPHGRCGCCGGVNLLRLGGLTGWLGLGLAQRQLLLLWLQLLWLQWLLQQQLLMLQVMLLHRQLLLEVTWLCWRSQLLRQRHGRFDRHGRCPGVTITIAPLEISTRTGREEPVSALTVLRKAVANGHPVEGEGVRAVEKVVGEVVVVATEPGLLGEPAVDTDRVETFTGRGLDGGVGARGDEAEGS